MKKLFFLIFLALFLSCITRKEGSESVKTTENIETVQPVESFSLDSIPDNIDNIIGVKKLGSVHSGEILKGNFYLKNNTNESLVLLEINGFCGCLNFEYDTKPIFSGEIRKIGYTFDTKQKYGFQYSTIKIKTNKMEYRVQFETEIK
ncbi:MAG: DUF1573 domain-containing protein [Rikenellaceae bacterium]